MRNRHHTEQGFTLIEILLSISITTAMLLLVVSFSFMLIQSRIKNQTVSEIEQQGAQIMQLMLQTIRDADAVITPSTGNTSSFLLIDTSDVLHSPVIFDISGGTIRITEGSSSPLSLSNDRVDISNLVFYNTSRSTVTDAVHIQFTLTHTNPRERQEYTYTETFSSGATVRFYQ